MWKFIFSINHQMNKLLSVNEESFQEKVLDSKQPVLIEFGATWCQPCKQVEALFEQLICEEWQGRLVLYKVDVDEDAILSMNYQVMSVPTSILFVNGKAVARLSGTHSRKKFSEMVSQYLSN